MNACFEGEFKVTSPYGWRILNGKRDNHKGIDLVGISSPTVFAPCDGVIGASTIVTDKSNRTWEWGNYVRLDTDSGGYSIFMCHLAKRYVKKGQKVKKGDRIGVMGCTGHCVPAGAKGTHTHFEVRKKGTSVTVDPAIFIGIPNKVGTYSSKLRSIEEEIEGYVSLLAGIGIITEPEKWKKKAAKDMDIYWLLRKVASKL